MRNSGKWTESRFRQFVIGALRSASNRWGPKFEVVKEARVERGVYLCAGYKKRPHRVPASLPPQPGKSKRLKNVYVDHIHPVVDPKKGFTTFDEFIERLFVEKDALQLLCLECHTRKTADEKELRKKNGNPGR